MACRLLTALLVCVNLLVLTGLRHFDMTGLESNFVTRSWAEQVRSIEKAKRPIVTWLSRVDAAEKQAERAAEGAVKALSAGRLRDVAGITGASGASSARVQTGLGTEISRRRLSALRRLLEVADGASTPASEAAHNATPPHSIVQLSDLHGAEYIGLIGVGSTRGLEGADIVPQAKLRVVYDTGSADLWVASDLCRTWPCTDAGRRSYNHTRSSTFRHPAEPKPVSTVYGSGELRGFLGFDDVRVGPLAVQGQDLGLISEERGAAFEHLSFDGIAGLAFPTLAVNGTTPLVDSLIAQGALPRREFAFYLHADPARGGAVLWGGTDERLHEGALQWFPVIEEAYWALEMLSMRVGPERFEIKPSSRVNLIVDSGTTLYALPNAMYDAVSRQAPVMPCADLASLPPLVFTLRGVSGYPATIEVPAAEYMVRSTIYEERCSAGFVRTEDYGTPQPMVIVGEIFMRHYLTAFRRGGAGESARVGVARARRGADVDAFFEEAQTGDVHGAK